MRVSAQRVAPLLAVAACGGGSSFAPLPPGATLEQACTAYISAEHQREATCYGVTAPPNVTVLEGREEQACVVESAGAGSNVNAAYWTACAAQASNDCQGYACPLPPGNLQNGAPCLANNQCASLWCNGTRVPGASGKLSTDAVQCGFCSTTLQENAPCDYDTDQCQSGLSCFDGTCRPTGIEGDACAHWSDCATALVCRSDGLCGEVLGLGATCEASTDCTTDEGCDAVTNVCVPISYAQPGAACDGDVNQCESGPCDVTDAASGVCPQVLADGSPCDPADPSTSCDIYAFCLQGVCQIGDPSACTASAPAPEPTEEASAEAGADTE